MFYAGSQTGWNMWAMGTLAGMLEFIKIMLATAYPFMQYRDSKRERKVSFYLKICFFLSIMASLNFFMSGGEISRSPASAITQLLYDYMPILNIIPLSFSQFLTTMSLSILVEAFIIFLPILAPIMFLEKDYDRKQKRNIANNNIEKLKEIVATIPDRLIDNLHKKVIGNLDKVEQGDIKVVEMRSKLKLIKSDLDRVGQNEKIENKEIKQIENTKIDYDSLSANDLENVCDYNSNLENENIYEAVSANDLEIIKKAIMNHKIGDIAPSLTKLEEFTGMQKRKIQACKRELEKENFIKTNGNKTYVLGGAGVENLNNDMQRN
jgi:predicted transcriptional regulator